MNNKQSVIITCDLSYFVYRPTLKTVLSTAIAST